MTPYAFVNHLEIIIPRLGEWETENSVPKSNPSGWGSKARCASKRYGRRGDRKFGSEEQSFGMGIKSSVCFKSLMGEGEIENLVPKSVPSAGASRTRCASNHKSGIRLAADTRLSFTGNIKIEETKSKLFFSKNDFVKLQNWTCNFTRRQLFREEQLPGRNVDAKNNLFLHYSPFGLTQ